MKRRELLGLESVLGFAPAGMTRWLDPPALARTAMKAGMAKVFADYGDKREVQAVLPSAPAQLASPVNGDVWIDFAADLGDGFDATTTIATLLAAPTLFVDTPGGVDLELPRGDVLVLGGDEVYPAGSARAYENRTIGPYATAFPAEAGAQQPTMLAVPGNHDWYDGLTSFLRVFARGARIGGWQTTQTRSYFVVAIAPGWWLVGLDSQLGEYIDEPQLAYFRQHLTAHLRPGDGVIVCTAAPAWVHTATKGPDGFNQLHFFDRTIVRTRETAGTAEPTGAAVRLWLTGDQHHYSRYVQLGPDGEPDEEHGVQAITCGLGGAYLAETHRLPETLELPPATSRMRSKDVPGMPMRRVGPTYPDTATSRRLYRRVANPFSRWWLGWRNPGLMVGIGWVQFVLAWLLGAVVGLVQTAPDSIGAVLRGPVPTTASALGVVVAIALGSWLLHWLMSLLFGWGGVVATLAIVFQLVAGCLTLLALVGLLLAARSLGMPPLPGIVLLGVAAIGSWGLGALLGTAMFGFFLLTQPNGTVASWRMSAQAIADHKGFLRMRLQPNGSIQIHAIVIDRICTDWATTTAADGGMRVVPAARITGVRLLDGPITITRNRGATPAPDSGKAPA